MIFIENEGHNNPHLNLAQEEYIVRNFSSENDYLLFYINSPSIIIGKNQITVAEVQQNYIDNHDIKVVRRVSGGGAVYHDLGNLNFSFITNHDVKKLHNFKQFTQPVIDALKSLGLNAALQGRNDIEINGKKISGTAQFSTGKRMISHGTLLLNTDLNEVTNALHVKKSKIESKGHKSVRSRVANINDFLKNKITMTDFRSMLLKELFAGNKNFKTHHLTPQEWEGVRQLKKEKYDTWEWNYGRAPKFNIQRTQRFSIGEIDLRIFIEKGKIASLHIYGDFFGSDRVSDLEEQLQGIRYEKTALTSALDNIDISNYFGALEKDDFIKLLYGVDELGKINDNELQTQF